MMETARLLLYGNSIFLAGIKADLMGNRPFELITLEAGRPDAFDLICSLNPGAILFDLAAAQPNFVVSLLRRRPGLLLIGVDPSSDELLVLSSQLEQAHSMADLVKVIHRNRFNGSE